MRIRIGRGMADTTSLKWEGEMHLLVYSLCKELLNKVALPELGSD